MILNNNKNYKKYKNSDQLSTLDYGRNLVSEKKEVEGYDEMVLVKDIAVESHCEHHIVPILGKAHVAYIPNNRVVGISKLARIVDVFGKRLQTQETMTQQIANTIENVLKPKGSKMGCRLKSKLPPTEDGIGS